MVKYFRKKRFLFASFFLALVFLCGVSTPVTLAFTVSGHKWANSSTYYYLDSTYTNQNSGWSGSANTAYTNWNSADAYFKYYLGNPSEKIIVTAGSGSCAGGNLANTQPSYAAFTGNIVNVNLKVVVTCGWPFFDGTQNGGVLPANYYDLKSVLRHEIGHAQGLCHSNPGANLMYYAYGKAEVKNVDTDAVHGSAYIYSGLYSPESGCIN